MKKQTEGESIKIFRRFLTDKEIILINRDTKLYPDLTYVSPNLWKSFSEHFVMYYGKEFAGVCATIHLNKWIKLGPFVLRGSFKGKGLGTKLFSYIVNRYSKKNIYIGSSNPALGSITKKFGFKMTKSFFSLPKEVQKYLLIAFWRFLNPMFFAESIRKLIKYGKTPYTFYLRKLEFK